VEKLNQLRYGHNSTIITKSLVVGVEIGIPSPEGYIPVIPKYVSCKNSAWKKGTISFCRILSEYGPNGILNAMRESGMKLTYDPIYRAHMVYISLDDIIEYNNPKKLFEKYIFHEYKNIDPIVYRILEEILDDIDIKYVGLTGSYSLGMQNNFSDIDIVIYKEKNAENILKSFLSKTQIIECKNNFGGVLVEGPCLSWRRGRIFNKELSWTGIPSEISGNCPLLRDYRKIRIPTYINTITIKVDEGQPSALVYPPCVKDENGRYIVSFEYNTAYLLYTGGNLIVSGLYNGGSLFIGTREYPGYVKRKV
jgi:predicted nucleotidyltransferase